MTPCEQHARAALALINSGREFTAGDFRRELGMGDSDDEVSRAKGVLMMLRHRKVLAGAPIGTGEIVIYRKADPPGPLTMAELARKERIARGQGRASLLPPSPQDAIRANPMLKESHAIAAIGQCSSMAELADVLDVTRGTLNSWMTRNKLTMKKLRARAQFERIST